MFCMKIKFCLKDLYKFIGKECWFYDVPETPLEDCPKGVLIGVDESGFIMSYNGMMFSFDFCEPCNE